jgi:hypothetical protein
MRENIENIQNKKNGVETDENQVDNTSCVPGRHFERMRVGFGGW